MAAVPSSKCDNNKVRHAQPNCRLSIQDTVPAPPLSLPCTPLHDGPCRRDRHFVPYHLSFPVGNPTHSSMGRAPKDSDKNRNPSLPLEKASQTWAAEKARVAILNASRGRGEGKKKGHRKAGPADPEESTELRSLRRAGQSGGNS